jgi:hypothetical protein
MSSESRKSEKTYPKEETVNPWGTSEGQNSSLAQEEGTNHVKRGKKNVGAITVTGKSSTGVKVCLNQ